MYLINNGSLCSSSLPCPSNHKLLIHGLFLLAMFIASASNVRADMIGVNLGDSVGFVGGVAGVVPQNNWMNVGTNSALALPLTDNSGSPTTAQLTFAGNILPSIQNPILVAGQDEALNNSYVASFSSPLTVTVTGIPYASYDLITYVSTIFTGRTYSTTVGSTTLYGLSPDPTSAGYIDGLPSPYTYTAAVGTTVGTATPNGNYFRFNGLTGSTLTFAMDSTNDLAGLTAFQIVAVPEPSSIALLGIGSVGLLFARRRVTRS